MESEYRKRWLPIVADHRIMDLVESMSRANSLVPRSDPTLGTRYLEAEKVLGKEPGETRSILDELVEKGILEKKVYSKDIGCPSCGSSNISTVYRCNRCSSINIAKNALIEHNPCGNIGPKDTFIQPSGKMICPNCNVDLLEGSFRSIGSWYECLDCKKRISNPEPQHICRNCPSKFTFEDARYEDTYSYVLNDTAFLQLRKMIDSYQPLRDALAQKGYDTAGMGRLNGASGVVHEFTLSAKKNGEHLVVEVSISKTPIEQADVLQWFAKVVDTKAQAWFVVVPGLDAIASKLAAAYKLNVIQAISVEEAALELMARIP